jgi:TolA-binding protein
MKRYAAAMAVAILAFGATATAEPSVYGGGYGSGGAQAQRNKKMIYSLRQQVNRLQEEVDGLRSIIEGLSQQINQLRRQKSAGGGVTPEQLSRLERRIAELEKRPAAPQSTPAAKKKPKSASAAAGKTAGKSAPAAAKKGGGDDYLKKAASDKLFSRGVRLINQKRYAEAKKRFDILKGRNYKPASTHFYLGEIAYRTGNYDDAVLHYQKSAELNENAAYMDRLLLHTGIALEKSGDKEQARNFFQAIVDGYPGTSSASVAKKHLK